MPTYEYACTSCGERLEVVQKFSDDPLTVCPACNGSLRKLFSAVGVVFKGSGFYKTDSRSGNGKGGSTSKPAESTPTADKPAASTESTGTPTSTPASGDSKPAASSGERVA